jgi:hypothetical protein
MLQESSGCACDGYGGVGILALLRSESIANSKWIGKVKHDILEQVDATVMSPRLADEGTVAKSTRVAHKMINDNFGQLLRNIRVPRGDSCNAFSS